MRQLLIATLLVLLPLTAAADTDQPAPTAPVSVQDATPAKTTFRSSDDALTGRVVRAYSGILLALVVVGGAFYLARRKGLLPGVDPLTGDAIKVIALRQVSAHLKVAIVEVDGKRSRIAFNQHSIQVLEDNVDAA